jgi:hypothetical protein
LKLSPFARAGSRRIAAGNAIGDLVAHAIGKPVGNEVCTLAAVRHVAGHPPRTARSTTVFDSP